MPLGLARFSNQGRQPNLCSCSGNTYVDLIPSSKFGSGLLNFDGVDDQLTAFGLFENNIEHSNFIFAGDFTIECWVNPYANQNSSIISNATSTTIGANQFQIKWIYEDASHGRFDFKLGSNTAISGTTQNWSNPGSYFHVALVRLSNTTSLYVNGTASGTTSSYSSAVGTSTYDDIYFGLVGTADDLSGFIDEVRVSTTARYTTNFASPASAFTNDSNTVLLLHFDGIQGSTTISDDTR